MIKPCIDYDAGLCHYWFLDRLLFVYDAVLKLSKFRTVPAPCCSYEIAGDALEFVNLVALAVRTFLKVGICIFISAVHAAVAVVVYRAVSDLIFVHEVND